MVLALVSKRPDTPETLSDAIDCFEELLSASEEGRCSISLSRRCKAAIDILKEIES